MHFKILKFIFICVHRRAVAVAGACRDLVASGHGAGVVADTPDGHGDIAGDVGEIGLAVGNGVVLILRQGIAVLVRHSGGPLVLRAVIHMIGGAVHLNTQVTVGVIGILRRRDALGGDGQGAQRFRNRVVGRLGIAPIDAVGIVAAANVRLAAGDGEGHGIVANQAGDAAGRRQGGAVIDLAVGIGGHGQGCGGDGQLAVLSSGQQVSAILGDLLLPLGDTAKGHGVLAHVLAAAAGSDALEHSFRFGAGVAAQGLSATVVNNGTRSGGQGDILVVQEDNRQGFLVHPALHLACFHRSVARDLNGLFQDFLFKGDILHDLVLNAFNGGAGTHTVGPEVLDGVGQVGALGVGQGDNCAGLDRSAAIADMRFTFIEKICESTVVKPKESRERIRSERIDRVLTGKYTAIPCFIVIMLAVFYLTFNVIGAGLQWLLEQGIGALTALTDKALTAAGVNEVLHGLVIDGIFQGVGSVLSFLPIIVTLFFFLSLMEDSGYIARVAFFMDKLLRKIGLSGRSIVPMLIGFGCTVPAVMATRTLPSERDRRMTILLTPFMSCSAKLPIYAFFVSAFFPKHGGLVMGGLYFLGIIVGILFAFIYRKTLFRGDAVPFVMELPNYRMPGAKNVCQLLWEKAKDFLQKAFTVILIATMLIWFLQSFDIHFNMVTDSKDSMLAAISSVIVPVFKPLGLGDWRICTSLISGLMAKESVVSTLEILFGGTVTTALTTLSAASLLVFSLLYSPCVAAIASIKRELGAKWAVSVVLLQCAIAWVAAFIVRVIGLLVM